MRHSAVPLAVEVRAASDCETPCLGWRRPCDLGFIGTPVHMLTTPVVPFAQRAVAALPHDAHFMGIVLTALNALSTVHPEQNPALAGQNIYKSKEIQDKQIVRLIGRPC